LTRWAGGLTRRLGTAVVSGDLDYAQRLIDTMRREGIYREVN
jgi:hypothetical protein